MTEWIKRIADKLKDQNLQAELRKGQFDRAMEGSKEFWREFLSKLQGAIKEFNDLMGKADLVEMSNIELMYDITISAGLYKSSLNIKLPDPEKNYAFIYSFHNLLDQRIQPEGTLSLDIDGNGNLILLHEREEKPQELIVQALLEPVFQSVGQIPVEQAGGNNTEPSSQA